MGVTSRNQVSSSLLCSFNRFWIGSSKIGLSQARNRYTFEYKARTRGWSFLSCLRLRFLFRLSRGPVDHRCERAIVATGELIYDTE